MRIWYFIPWWLGNEQEKGGGGLRPALPNYQSQEGRSVNARLNIAAFSHILETSIIFHRFSQYIPNLISYFDLARLVPIKKS